MYSGCSALILVCETRTISKLPARAHLSLHLPTPGHDVQGWGTFLVVRFYQECTGRRDRPLDSRSGNSRRHGSRMCREFRGSDSNRAYQDGIVRIPHRVNFGSAVTNTWTRIDDANSAARRYRGGIHATGMIIRESGISELYRGLLSTTLKQSATSAVRMGSYNVLKDLCARNNLPNSSAVTFATGAVAGVITVYATQPFDTVKTKSQSARGAGTMEAFRMVFGESGVRGFWRGSSMRLGRLVFSGGIVFTVYEKVAALLSR